MKRKSAKAPGWDVVAKAIRRARRACGLTQKQLGQRLGLKGGAQAVYRWERGTSAPSARRITALLAALAGLNAPVADALRATLDRVIGELSDPGSIKGADSVEPGRESRQTQTGAAGVASEQSSGAPGQQVAAEGKRYPLRRPFAIDYLILRMADELDVPARRLRAPLLQLLRNLHSSDFALPVVIEELATWIERANSAQASEPAALARELR
jgi:transcriptional regulator with XRE-family HTH domain